MRIKITVGTVICGERRETTVWSSLITEGGTGDRQMAGNHVGSGWTVTAEVRLKPMALLK